MPFVWLWTSRHIFSTTLKAEPVAIDDQELQLEQR